VELDVEVVEPQSTLLELNRKQLPFRILDVHLQEIDHGAGVPELRHHLRQRQCRENRLGVGGVQGRGSSRPPLMERQIGFVKLEPQLQVFPALVAGGVDDVHLRGGEAAPHFEFPRDVTVAPERVYQRRRPAGLQGLRPGHPLGTIALDLSRQALGVLTNPVGDPFVICCCFVLRITRAHPLDPQAFSVACDLLVPCVQAPGVVRVRYICG